MVTFRNRLSAIPAAILIAALGMASCQSAPATAAPAKPPAAKSAKAPAVKPALGLAAPTEAAARVMAIARSLLGQKPYAKVLVRGRSFTLDCIGTVSAAWWGAGYDIQRDFGKHEGNGVKRLYESLAAWGALPAGRRPAPGDFIFWENTYDRNENGRLYDDGITHAGIVMAVDADSTIQYLHLSYSRGVVLAYCNLDHPDRPFGPGNKVWNSPMFLGSSVGGKNNPPKWLSGELWKAFGKSGPATGASG
jgi:cell wall-associated NlpC family hydrolase